MGRPLTYFRLPGLDAIDSFYYTAENVDRQTISRFYGYALEDPGPGALRQFAPYLKSGHLLSADKKVDYSARLREISVPALMVAGARDLISDVPSTRMTFDALGSHDKTLYVFSKANGHVADYGHCDLVWSRYAPREVFPVIIDWLDRRQPGVTASRQQPAGMAASTPQPAPLSGQQKRFDANL
jgi:pimeloyl-ACP methyl ester carboxylesterase